MAMLIAWQTVNSVRRPQSRRFTRGFLVVTPGITIKDRLRVLQPNDPDSYYQSRELVPNDMLPDLEKAKIVITNYHAFKQRERMELSRGGRSLLQGRGEELTTLETEGQMLQRVMPELMGLKNIWVLNDEAHHCYREKPGEREEDEFKGDDRREAEKNTEAARLWISGLEIVGDKLGINRVMDLSATPFFYVGRAMPKVRCFRGRCAISRSWTPLNAASSNCPACRWPTTSPAAKCPSFAISGNTFARTCRRRDGARLRPSIPSVCLYSYRPRWTPCTDIIRKLSS